MAELRYNAKTYKAVRLENNEWVDTPVKYNDKTGDRIAWDGDAWSPVGKASATSSPGVTPEFSDMRNANAAKKMTSDDLDVARTKNDEMGAYLRNQSKELNIPGESGDARFKRLFGSIPQAERPGQAETAIRGYAQGGLLSGQDEVTAGALAMKDAYAGDAPFTDAYSQRLIEQRTKQMQGREDHPWTAYGTEAVGGISTSLLPFLNAVKGGQYGNAMKTGAGQGGIYGWNAGEGNTFSQKGFLDNLKSAGKYAGFGTALGGVTAGIGHGVSAYARNRAQKQAAQSSGMSLPQWQALNQSISADVASGSGQQFLGPRLPQGMTPDTMLADLGAGTNRALDNAIIKSPMAANVATRNVGNRAGGQNAKLGAVLDSTLGKPSGVRAIGRQIAENTKEGRHGEYTAAYATAIDWASSAGRKIEDVISRIDVDTKLKAFKNANARMLADGKKNEQIMYSLDEATGIITTTNPPNTMQLDYLKRALDTMGRESLDALGNVKHEGRMWTGLARELRNAVKDAVPTYGSALKLGKDKIDQDQALQLGTKLLNKNVTREIVEDMTDGMSDDSRRAIGAGFRSFIDERLANVKAVMSDPNIDQRQARDLLQLLSSQATKDKIRMIAGDDAAEAIFKQLDESMPAFELKAAVARGSDTGRRVVADRASEALEKGGVQEQFRTGELKGSIKSLWAAVAERTPAEKQAVSNELYMNIAEALTGPQGGEALEMFRKILKVQPSPKIEAIVSTIGKAAPKAAVVTNPILSYPGQPSSDYLLNTGRK